MKPTLSDDARLHLAASLITLLILCLFAALLLRSPVDLSNSAHRDDDMRLVFLPSQPLPVPSPQPDTPPQADTPPASTRTATPTHAPTTAVAPATPPTARTNSPAVADVLYTRDGRVRLPPGAIASGGGRPPGLDNPDDAARAKRIMERPNPVDYKPTRFAKDWKSDGNILEVAGQSVGRFIDGLVKDDGRGPATARPPPSVAFNPSRHERPEDLGSEATGDAYKAAPIPFEKAPQPPGAGGERIRAELLALQTRSTQCPDSHRQALLKPVRLHLKALDAGEYATNHGADPTRMQSLPQEIDHAYDLARRAVWYAQQQLDRCGR